MATSNHQDDDTLAENTYLQPDCEDQFINNRVNKDHVRCVYGRRLLDLCRLTGLVIANGRLGHDDQVGEYTYSSHQGQSTVDYLLFKPADMQYVRNFEILPFNEYSDQAGLHIELTTKLHSCVSSEPSTPLRLAFH